jgi:hypothetical protein
MASIGARITARDEIPGDYVSLTPEKKISEYALSK